MLAGLVASIVGICLLAPLAISLLAAGAAGLPRHSANFTGTDILTMRPGLAGMPHL